MVCKKLQTVAHRHDAIANDSVEPLFGVAGRLRAQGVLLLRDRFPKDDPDAVRRLQHILDRMWGLVQQQEAHSRYLRSRIGAIHEEHCTRRGRASPRRPLRSPFRSPFRRRTRRRVVQIADSPDSVSTDGE